MQKATLVYGQPLWRHPYMSKTLLVMKLISLLLFGACLQVSAHVHSQTIHFSGKDVPLADVFNVVEQQTGYVFFYPQGQLKNAHPVSVDVDKVPLKDFLEVIFKDQPFGYRIESTGIIVSAKKEVEGSLLSRLFAAASPPVNGVVVDEDGNPLADINVTVKGTNVTVVTDTKGRFTVSAESGNTLVFSSVTHENKEWRLGKNISATKTLTISLDKKITSLNEVIVNKGYYTTSQRFNTGNVTKVSGDELRKQPVNDPLLALEAKVPGLYIEQNSGVPGAYSTIRLRGVNAISSPGTVPTLNDPLFIVDGVPFSTQSSTIPFIQGSILGDPPTKSVNSSPDYQTGLGQSPFTSINPADIESIEVLKDADATAIYGTRGANGVILITTRKGRPGKTRLDVNISSGSGKITRMLDLMNTAEYLAMRREAFKNDGIVPGPADYDVNGIWDTTRYTNWQKTLIGKPDRFYSANLMLSGGTQQTQFSISGGYNRENPPIPGNFSSSNASVHSSISHRSDDGRFRADFTAGYSSLNSNLPANNHLLDAILLAPDAPALFDSKEDLNWELHDGAPTWRNPIAFTLQPALHTGNTLLSDLVLRYTNIVPGFSLQTSLGYSQSHNDQTNQFPIISQYPNGLSNSNRLNNYGSSNTHTWIIEPLANYDKKIGLGELSASLGGTFMKSFNQAESYVTSGFSSDALIGDPALSSYRNILGYTTGKDAQNGGFARLGYNYNKKYLLNLSGRRDVSSRFGPGRQLGNFGSVGAGWIFTEERFMHHLPVLSFGKLRASYGTTGSDNIANYQYLSTYTFQPPTYQGLPGLAPSGLANVTLQWERVKKLEAGLELGFFKDRLNFSVSAYRNRCDDQLIGYNLSSVTGFGGVISNLPALVQNQGLEFDLHATPIKTQHFSWTISGNLSISRNKLVNYPDLAASPYRYTFSIGRSLFVKYVPHYLGINPQSGYYNFASKDGSGFPTFPQDMVWSKDITQSYFGGFQNGFHYRQFSLDVSFQFVKQYKSNFLSGSSTKPSPGYFNSDDYHQNTLGLFGNRWQKPGDLTSIEKFSTGYDPYPAYAYSQLQGSDGIYTDASFIRLKNLAIGYQFPSSWLRKMHTENAGVSLNAQNLLTITKYIGLDPETGSLLPPMRMITCGVHVTL